MRLLRYALVSLAIVGLAAATATAKKKRDCIGDCKRVQEFMLKSCEQIKTKKGREKCRTLGPKKVMDECMKQCKNYKGKKKKDK